MANNKKASSLAGRTKSKPWWVYEFPWAGVAGSILMFLAWILQNQYVTDAADEKARLDRSQLSIDLQQMRMEQWQGLYLQEKSKPDPNKTVLLASAFKTLQSKMNLAAWGSARIRDKDSDAARDILDRDAVQHNLAAWFRNGDLPALERELSNVASVEEQLHVTDQLTKKFQQRFADVRRRQEHFTFLFFALYVVGTFMLAIQFLLTFRRERVQAK